MAALRPCGHSENHPTSRMLPLLPYNKAKALKEKVNATALPYSYETKQGRSANYESRYFWFNQN